MTTALHKEWWNKPGHRRRYLLAVSCSYCGAKKGKPCVTKSGRTVRHNTIAWHGARYGSAGHPAYKAS